MTSSYISAILKGLVSLAASLKSEVDERVTFEMSEVYVLYTHAVTHHSPWFWPLRTQTVHLPRQVSRQRCLYSTSQVSLRSEFYNNCQYHQ